MFTQLEAMAPGRIDLGMGRATAGTAIDLALQQNREQPAQVSHQQQLTETLAWLYEDFPEGHPFAGHPLSDARAPGVGVPQTWMLGSSSGGSALAGVLGIGYTFAGFINPNGSVPALRTYRSMFQPQGHGPDRPRAMLAVNITVGEDREDGLR